MFRFTVRQLLVWVAAIAVVITFVLFLFNMKADVSVTAQVVDGSWVFECVPTWRVHRMKLIVYRRSTDETLWEVHLPTESDSFKGAYGELQEGMRQVIPENGNSPRQIPVDTSLELIVSYGFDCIFPPAPCGNLKRHSFKLSSGGNLTWDPAGLISLHSLGD